MAVGLCLGTFDLMSNESKTFGSQNFNEFSYKNNSKCRDLFARKA